MDVQPLVFGAGIVFGGIAIVTACAVWLRHQTFGAGGAALSLIGVILVGLSVWTGVRVEVHAGGFSADFERLVQQVTETAEASRTLSEEVGKIADGNEANRRGLVDLATTLGQRQAIDPQAAAAIEREALAAPQIDRGALNAIRNLPTRVNPGGAGSR